MAVACLNRDMNMGPIPDKHNISKEQPDTRLPWFALQVRARREQIAADYLQGKGYELLLPLYKTRRRWSDRIKETMSPLFPGYLFCRFDPRNRLPILKTPWVICIVGFSHSLIPVNPDEIRAVQTLVASGLPSRPHSFLEIGDIVRIESGPLCGLRGVLIKVKGSHRLVISVTLLQRAVAVEIDSYLVTPVRSNQAKLSDVSAASAPAPSLI